MSQQIQADKYIIRGKIIDSVTGNPVVYATINVLDEKRNTVTSTYSGESGAFTIFPAQPGNYVVEITSVGYRIAEIPVALTALQSMVNMDQVYLAADAAYLQGVTITSRKKIIEQRPGMLVYHAENDVTNNGGTAADVLRKTPILNVDAQGNVTMRGSANLKILINGKYSGQIARSPADALNMMPADNIKSVEVITTPSAKYDAEGAAGVINIITKKGYKNINGALELSASNLEQMFNPRIAVTNDKWNISLHGHLHRLRSKETISTERIQMENGLPVLQLNQELNKDNAAPHGSGDLAIVFIPDSLTELSFGMNAWFGNWPDDSRIQTMVSEPGGTITEQYSQTVDAKESYLGSDINIGYNRKFKKPGREITLLTQFTPARSRLPYHILQTDKDNLQLYEELNSNKTNSREWTWQADYIHPFSNNNKYILESGFKIILRNVDNVYNVSADDQPLPSRSDQFKYEQDVWAGYSMMKANLKKNWYVEAGLRLEETILHGNFIQSGASFNNRFTNLIPTATISKKISEDQTVTASYTQRLTRPYIWDLNPNANASDPKNIIVGNPELQPEITRQAELTYGLNRGTDFFLNTALFWKHTDNAIVDFTSTDAGGISTTSKQNLAANGVYGLNLSSFITLSPRWSMNGNININYLDYNSNELQIYSKGWATDIDLNTTLKLPHDYSLQVFGDYNTRAVTLQGYKSFQYYYSFAAKKALTKKKIVITLAAVNPFSRYIPQTVTIRTANFYSTVDNRYFYRAFKITVNWEFGSMFGERNRKKIINDDVKDQGKG
jgi:outer membrane receptor protein involved in Fe transport